MQFHEHTFSCSSSHLNNASPFKTLVSANKPLYGPGVVFRGTRSRQFPSGFKQMNGRGAINASSDGRNPSTSAKTMRFFIQLKLIHQIHRKFVPFAAKDEPNFDSYDQMELKFGRLIGEDPKLTLAKIIGRKTNPEMSYLEIEKLYNKKGLKAFTDIEEVPFDISDVKRKPKDSLDGVNLTRPVPNKEVKFETKDSSDGLNLTRPVPNKVVKFETKDSSDGLNLTQPVPKKGVKFEANEKPVAPEVKRPNQSLEETPSNLVASVPNVELRKPTTFNDDDVLISMRPRQNLSFKVNKEEEKDGFTDMTMVRKPAPYVQKEETEVVDNDIESESQSQIQADVSLLQKPGIDVNQDFGDQSESSTEIDELKNSSRSVNLAFEMEKEDGCKSQEIDYGNDDLTAFRAN